MKKEILLTSNNPIAENNLEAVLQAYERTFKISVPRRNFAIANFEKIKIRHFPLNNQPIIDGKTMFHSSLLVFSASDAVFLSCHLIMKPNDTFDLRFIDGTLLECRNLADSKIRLLNPSDIEAYPAVRGEFAVGVSITIDLSASHVYGGYYQDEYDIYGTYDAGVGPFAVSWNFHWHFWA